MKKLLLLFLLMPIVSFGDFDEYGRSAGGFSLIPDFLAIPLMFLIVGWVILLVPYSIYLDIKQKNQHKKTLKKMKALKADKKIREVVEKVEIFVIRIFFLGCFIFWIMLFSGSFGNVFSGSN